MQMVLMRSFVYFEKAQRREVLVSHIDGALFAYLTIILNALSNGANFNII